MRKQKVYKLVSGRTNPGWEVKQYNVFAERFDKNGESLGLRQIQYVKGAKSFWVEDNLNHLGEMREHTPIWIENGIMAVDESDKVLNEFLQIHPDFGNKFYLWDEGEAAQKELEFFEEQEYVRERLGAMSPEDLRALAVVKYGLGAVRHLPDTKVKLTLYQDAMAEPIKFRKNYLDDKDVNDMLFTALAFQIGVITTSRDMRAILWGDTGHEIIKLGKGEEPLETFTEFLKSEDGLTTKQAIGAKIEKRNNSAASTKKPGRKPATAANE